MKNSLKGLFVRPQKGPGTEAHLEGIGLKKTFFPQGPGLSRNHPVGMEGLSPRLALPWGRTECAPPSKGPFAKSWGLVPKPVSHRLSGVAEGRALQARGDGLRLTEACAL